MNLSLNPGLRSFGFDQIAGAHAQTYPTKPVRLIERAMERVIAEARCLTRDLGGSAGTRAMGDAVANAVSTA